MEEEEWELELIERFCFETLKAKLNQNRLLMKNSVSIAYFLYLNHLSYQKMIHSLACLLKDQQDSHKKHQM